MTLLSICLDPAVDLSNFLSLSQCATFVETDILNSSFRGSRGKAKGKGKGPPPPKERLARWVSAGLNMRMGLFARFLMQWGEHLGYKGSLVNCYWVA